MTNDERREYERNRMENAALPPIERRGAERYAKPNEASETAATNALLIKYEPTKSPLEHIDEAIAHWEAQSNHAELYASDVIVILFKLRRAVTG